MARGQTGHDSQPSHHPKDPESVHPSQQARGLAIGYQLAVENNLVGMVMTQGPQRDIVNLGIGVKQIGVSPPDADPMAYAESYHHKAILSSY